MLFLLLTFLALTLTASSSRLALLLPPEDQLPLIARVGKPYSWSISPHTFGSPNGALSYSTSRLPSWLSFDPGTLNFHGTPSSKDEENSRITITAKDSSSSVSSTFALCVTTYPEPTLRLPISQQFSAPAPSLSSVFILAPFSGLTTSHPALRIPPKWSFSIGFESGTFWSESELYYEARQTDGSALPEWMVFDPDAITVNGVTPSEVKISQPAIVSLSLYVSDQKGFSSSSLPFDLVVAAHELSLANASLPTINVTAATPFNFTLSSLADFLGVLIDGKAIQSSEIMTLVVDTSQYGSWLKYDHGSRTLSGDPGNTTFAPGQSPPLLVTLTTTFNQSIRAPVHLAIVPSYFSTSALPPIQAAQGGTIQFNLRQDFSNATEHDDGDLTAAFQPPEAGDWLKFTPDTGQIVGTVPSSFDTNHITVTFTAYSRVTHSTSHASLSIVFAPPDTHTDYHPPGLSATAHPKLALGLGIAFGVVGGLCLIGGLLAVIRRCARVEDTAIGGEEGRNVWSEEDKKWYGVGLQRARGYGWSDRDPNFTEKPRPSLDYRASYNARHGIQEQYGDLGLGLRRVSERSQSQGSPGSNRSPGVISKREFFTRLRETVRVVSDRAQRRKVSRKRPVIGKPILPVQQVLPVQSEPPTLVSSPSNPFDEIPGLPSHPGSTIMTNSPSTSTAEHSIPRRRADFAPPRSPAQVHFDDGGLSRQLSSGSIASNTSEKMHAVEAVVRTASKATSIRSGRSASGRSFVAMERPLPTDARPKLVPFTSATRVPVPRRPSPPPGLQNDYKGASPSKRVVSQTAKVWKREVKDAMAKGGSSDELKMGLHYVESLGADPQTMRSRPEP